MFAKFVELYLVKALVNYTVVKYQVHMSVDGVAVIENYMTPHEMFKQMQVGNDEQYNAVAQQLRRTPAQLSVMVSV